MQRAIEYVHERYPEAAFYRSEFKGAHRGGDGYGYGSKQATDYKVRAGGRDYRVYCICWSNSGSLYIISKGERLYLNDRHLEAARAGTHHQGGVD
jgi:hypothetical protein